MSIAGLRRIRYVRPFTLFLIALMIRPPAAGADDVTPPTPPPPRPAIIGFADTHLHQFANLGFGGLEVWGSPMDPTGDATAPIEDARARALPDSNFVDVPIAQAPLYLGVGGAPAPFVPVTCADGSPCARITIHGPGGSNDLLNSLVPNGSTGHGVMGYPDMDGWPAFDVHTAQQAYWEWLQRAHQHGMKLMVMLAVNNSVLCQLGMRYIPYGCDDDGAVERQIKGAKDLEKYIDARSGGEGQGFYRIVYSADEARAAIQNNQMAVVLGTEVDTNWGCTTGAAGCTDSFIQGKVQEYYDDGIRVVYPVHLIDNKFGGAAVYNGLFELNNLLVNGDWFDIDPCAAPIEWRSDIRQFISDAQLGAGIAIGVLFALGPLGFAVALPILEGLRIAVLTAMPFFALLAPVLAPMFGDVAALMSIPGLGGFFLAVVAAVMVFAAPGAQGAATEGNCNGRTLSAEGHTLINALMDHEMIIDVDHTDTPTFDAILDIAEARHYPGIVSGHTGLIGAALTRAEIGASFNASNSARHEANKTNEQVERIINAGGFVSLGIAGGHRSAVRDFSASDALAFDCGRSTQAFAQSYLFATQTLGLTAVGFGSDINGFAGYPTPRYGAKACHGDHAPGYDAFTSTGRLTYPATDYFGAPLPQYTFGNRTWDYNVDGFANVGLFPDYIADLGALGLTNEQLAPLFNAAEAYVRMWEKVNDSEAPEVRCGTVGEAWHADDVTVPCLSFDIGWGLANAGDANFSLSTSVPAGTETGNASTGTHAAICDTDSNCSPVVGPITGINVDKKAPDITVTTPPSPIATYLLNQVVNANYGCLDGGSGLDSCNGPVANTTPLNTSTVGTYAFNVTGIDNVDNQASVNHPYLVSFNVCVLYDQTRVHRAGSTVPIRLQLCDAANLNVSSSSIALSATSVTQLSTSTVGTVEDAGQANPDDEFRFDGNGYVFNLKTTGLTTGTYALTFTATGDPNPHQVQFQIR
ncbi:MAG TPA: membrane dipeptidase [Vicinamibacterales bacterium]|nr:membrane dipeptidase [Vicinamibacterales bacterium]